MAFIRYVTDQELPSADRVPDSDNILQIYGVHPQVMHRHYQEGRFASLLVLDRGLADSLAEGFQELWRKPSEI